MTFDTRAGFQEAVRQALQAALAQGQPMAWLDEDFADWPLGEAALVQALTDWAQRSARARLRIVAREFDTLQRRHPRFVAWRQRFDHRIDARSPQPEDDRALPGLLLCGSEQAVWLLDRNRWRGRSVQAADEPAELQRLREQFDAVAQRASAAFGASTLGL